MTRWRQEDLKLCDPSLGLIDAYCRALREGFRRGIQDVASEQDIQTIEADPQTWLDQTFEQKGDVTLPNGETVAKVPFSNHWLMLNDRLVGEASFRHELNDVLRQAGGHIGYGIHPEFQGQGLGKELLKRTLDIAKAKGIRKVLLTADLDNIASWKIIEACGGTLQDEIADTILHHGDGAMLRRYWIEL